MSQPRQSEGSNSVPGQGRSPGGAPAGAVGEARAAAGEALIRMRNLRKVYRKRGEEFLAVSDVTMDIFPGDMVSLVGPSGCGKTTLLKILSGLQGHDGGTLRSGRRRLRPRPRRRHGVPAAAAAQVANGPGQRAAAGRDPGPATAQARERAQRTAGRWSGWPASTTSTRTSSRAACSSAPRSPRAGPRPQARADGRAVRRAGCADAREDEPGNAAHLGRGPAPRSSFVTHSIQEAVFLGSRCAVASPPGPARMADSFAIELPEPRTLAHQDHDRRSATTCGGSTSCSAWSDRTGKGSCVFPGWRSPPGTVAFRGAAALASARDCKPASRV